MHSFPNNVSVSETAVRLVYPNAEVTSTIGSDDLRCYSIQLNGRIISKGWWASPQSAWYGAYMKLEGSL